MRFGMRACNDRARFLTQNYNTRTGLVERNVACTTHTHYIILLIL